MLTWTKASAGPVTGASILWNLINKNIPYYETRRAYKWGTDESNIERDVPLSRKTLDPWKPSERSNTREYCIGRNWQKDQTPLQNTGTEQLTFSVDTTIYRLWKFNIFERYLVMVVVMGSDANQIRQQYEGRENL